MLVILTIAVSLIYRSISTLHQKLIHYSGIKTMNKENCYELFDFIYYEISTIVKMLLANRIPRAFLPVSEISTLYCTANPCFKF